MNKRKINLKDVFIHIFYFIKPFSFNIVTFIFIVLISAIIGTIKPYIIKIIVNKVASIQSSKIFNNLLIPIGYYISCLFINECVWRLHTYLMLINTFPKMRQNIIEYNFQKTIKHSWSFFQNTYSGKISQNITKLSHTIPDIIDTLLYNFFYTFLTLIISISILSKLNVKYSIIMLIWAILSVFFLVIINKKIVKNSHNLSNKQAQVSGKIVDILSNILSVKLFSSQNFEIQQIKNSTNKANSAEKKLQWLYFKMTSVFSIIYVLFQCICIVILAKDREHENVSVGDFALVLGLNNHITHLLWHNIRTLSDFTKKLGETKQALEFIYKPIKIFDIKNAKKLSIINGNIKIKNISYKYPDTNEPIFENLNLDILAKEKLGIVGYSGTGKSTLIKLLLRLYDVNNGGIYIDNQNIKKITQNSLRNKIGVITQDSILFHRTLEENISYGNPLAKKSEIINAAKLANAHDFIMKTPKGYDSMVGEKGVKISGGQRQRIIMARIILKNSPILVLDEATSNLDSINEKRIQESIFNLMKDKTTIVIAHRLSTLTKMDRIIVLDKGKIVEEGHHEKLIKKNGMYTKMWKTQVKGFLNTRNLTL